MTHDPLHTLQGRAEEESQEALRRLAELQQGCNQSESRLAVLERYRDEYRAKLSNATQSGVSAAQWNNFRAFLAKLEEAIAQQQTEVTHWRASVARGREQWQEAEKKARSFGILNDRRAEKARVAAARGEQKQTDEYATRMAQTRPWT